MGDFLEKTLEDIIYQNRHFIADRGFMMPEPNMIRQFILPSGMRMDLFSYDIKDDNTINCTIFELKKGEINISALVQVSAYYYEIRGLLEAHFQNINITQVLVGSSWSSEFYSVFEHLSNIKVFIYEYLIDGIKFELLPKREEMFKKRWYSDRYQPNENSSKFLHFLLTEKNVII